MEEHARSEQAKSRPWIGLAGALGILGGVIWFALRSEKEAAPAPLTLEERYLADPRIDPLIFDSPYVKTFDAPLTDMIGVWVSKLEHGTKEPLRQARLELAQAGPRAVPALERLWDEVVTRDDARWRSGVLENILQALDGMHDPAVLPIVRKAMIYSTGSVRLAALPALGELGGKEDYELVVVWLPVLETGAIQARYAEVLRKLDSKRYYDDVIQWLTEGRYSELWEYLMLSIAACDDREQAEAFKGLAALRDDRYAPFLMAPAAAQGDPDAREELMRRLNHERAGTRQLAVQAMAAMGWIEPLCPLVEDEHAGVRRLVVKALADAPSDLSTEYLRIAAKDEDREVRETARRELVARGDELTVAEVLAQLEGTVSERGDAINILRLSWDANPGSPERAYERLVKVWKREDSDPRARMSVLESLANVPLREAADFLLDFGRQFQGELKGKRAHRFICGLLWNTGSVGRDLLRETLATETDPFRRLDLIEFIWQDHSDASREVLLADLRDDSQSPYERLYAADRLTRLGPAELVAPVIKRVYLACTHQRVRPALQNLLWTWYGQHDFS